MKKLILSALAASVLVVSCKNTTEKAAKELENAMDKVEKKAEQATNEVKKTAENLVDDDAKKAVSSVEVPKFKSPEVQKFADEYANYYKEVSEAVKSGSAEKVQQLQTKATEWATKSQEYLSKNDSRRC
ncbi:conserved exported hypothetical protein [Capnocytophaga canimorsus]|uniref:Lipoprotein n=1 Tax=Capnocytophaga canimorsus TaxID=28188 RepID=A0A0B7HJI3_9FLAO|nr:hypothetical protein [Capnocytophaga canimorsus]CEN38072.1 conserved exported hypothetical protein [Capnocytophaga canimorsus]